MGILPLFLRPILAGLLLAVVSASAALAHAQLLGSTPSPNAVAEAQPEMAQLLFSEPVTAMAMTLIAPDGARTGLLDDTTSGETVTVALPAGLADGTYILSWRVVSVDAHPIGGSLLFSVGRATDAATMLPETDRLMASMLWAGKALLYVCLFFGAGGAVFALAATLPDRARRIATALCGAGLLAAPLTLGLTGLDALGLGLDQLASPGTWQAGAATSYGLTVLLHVAAFILAVLSLTIRRLGAVGFFAWAFGAASLALSGHASAADPQWLTRPAVFLHVGGILFWAGALLPLLIHMRDGAQAATQALTQFSRVIPFAVAPILVSGVTLGAVQLGLPGPHWLSPYAYILAAKLLLLAALFGLALWNRLHLTAPALAGQAPARYRLRLSIRAEIVLVLVILALVAGWRFTPPPRTLVAVAEVARSEPVLVHLMEGEVMAMATIDPGRAGIVTLDVAITDLEGAPLTPEAVTVTLSAPALGIEPFGRDAVEAGAVWRIENLAIPIAGEWHLEIGARINRFSRVTLQSDLILP